MRWQRSLLRTSSVTKSMPNPHHLEAIAAHHLEAIVAQVPLAAVVAHLIAAHLARAAPLPAPHQIALQAAQNLPQVLMNVKRKVKRREAAKKRSPARARVPVRAKGPARAERADLVKKTDTPR